MSTDRVEKQDLLTFLREEQQKAAASGWNCGTWQHRMEFLVAASGAPMMDATETGLSVVLYHVYERLLSGKVVSPPIGYGRCSKCQQIIYLPNDHDFWCGERA